MAWCDSLFVSLRTDKLGWVSKPYVTHLLDGFSALSDPDHISTTCLSLWIGRQVLFCKQEHLHNAHKTRPARGWERMAGKTITNWPTECKLWVLPTHINYALIVVDINPIKSNDKAAIVDLHYFCQGAKLQKLRFRKCSRCKEMEMFCRLAKNVKLAQIKAKLQIISNIP